MRKLLFSAFLFLLAGQLSFAEDGTRLLRFPDVHGDTIAFVYAGDIWTVPVSGGNAKRLTSHPGLELFPKISPDGRWIAFSAQYSGSRQVYVMPVAGGEPKQLTWYNDVGVMPPRGGFDNIVLDWTPDSQHILIRANRTPWGKRMGKYYLVSLSGGLEKPLPIPEAGFGSFSPDGKKICYTPISREFRTWKRYKGGRAADVWIYDLEASDSKRLTTFPGTDQIPHWYKDGIYFASDRDKILNIYRYDVNSGKIREITTHQEFDVMWPSGSGGLLAYENGGRLFVLNLETEETREVVVHIRFDNPAVLPYFKQVKDDIHSMTVSPSGKRAVFDARGDLFSVPAEHGRTVNLTESGGVREIFPAWSPDGRWLAYCSDVTGEYEIYLMRPDGEGDPRQLTSNSSAWKFQPTWSPDSKWLLYADKTQSLKVIDVKSGEERIVDHADRQEIRDYGWSPDSRWIAYAKNAENGQMSIWAFNLKTGITRRLTGDTFDDMSPVFSTDGKYLFFISDRDFNLAFSSFEFDYVYNNAARIYALPLTDQAPRLFEFAEDVEPVNGEDENNAKKGNRKPAKVEKDVIVDIQFEGAEDRVVAFPLPSGRYWNLNAVKDGVLYHDDKGLHRFNLKKQEEEMIMGGIRNSMPAAGGDHFLYRSGADFGIAALSPGQKPGTGKLDLDGLSMKIDPRQEWEQIYVDGWRIFRDWFYAGNMHGVDWKGVRARYAQLLPYVSHRADLDYIFGEMVGEVNVGHAYVNWGDMPKVKRVDTGLLGCEFEADEDRNLYRIAHIYPGENWNPDRRSPLTEQGIDVQEGDYLVAIDGHSVTLKDNPYRFLENTVGRKVLLTVKRLKDGESTRTVEVKPVASELELRYLDWVESRRAMVDRMSNGRIGYIHVPNTSFEGNRELFRGMYAYHEKEALIIDDRYNGGGFIPDVMVELLDRTTLNYWARRGVAPNPTPGVAHDGPKVMLINHYSSSGGDALPYYFRKKKLGLLIGTRTWGGLVGLSGNAGLVDGGSISVPSFGVFDTDGNWVVEGVGVAPDIEVYDEPQLVAAGKDPCIEKAVSVLMQKLKENPVTSPPVPAEPDRSGWVERPVPE